jgi:hypothetical protein
MERSIKTRQRKVREINIKTKAGTIELDILGNTTNVDITANSLLSASHGLVTGDRILFTEDASPTALSIGAAGVTNASNTFTSTDHGFITGDKVLVTEDNTLPSGLTTATTYFAILVDADNFKLASSYANAIAGTAVSISDDGTGANSYDAVPAPTNLTSATQYWVIKVDVDNFKLATTYANAVAGTAVDLVDHGTGTNEFDLVEELDGLDKFQVSIKATAVGTYVITLDEAFANANSVSVVGNVAAADKAITIDTVAAGSITVKVNDIDETAALSDGFFHLRIIGSDITDRY